MTETIPNSHQSMREWWLKWSLRESEHQGMMTETVPNIHQCIREWWSTQSLRIISPVLENDDRDGPYELVVHQRMMRRSLWVICAPDSEIIDRVIQSVRQVRQNEMIESSQTVLSKYQSLKDWTHSKTSNSFFAPSLVPLTDNRQI